jgi:hypothetical protein
MLNFHGELRVTPLNAIHAGTFECSPRRAETLNLGKEVVSFISGKRNEGRSGVAQSVTIYCEQAGL